MNDVYRDVRKRNITDDSADWVADMENLQGLFIFYYNANQMDRIADMLFAANETVCLKLPDCGKYYAGIADVSRGLLEIQKDRAAAVDAADIHMLHTPCFYVADDAKSAKGNWDTYSYHICKNDSGQYQCETIITRFDVEFVRENGETKMQSLSWRMMQSWIPASYSPEQIAPLRGLSEVCYPEQIEYLPDAEDFVQIQQLQNYFVHNHMKSAWDLFADEEDTSFAMQNLFPEVCRGPGEIRAKIEFLLEREIENEEKYLCLMINTTPVILCNDTRTRARGWFWVQTFELKGTAFGRKSDEVLLVRNVCQLQAEYTKKDGRWKIRHMDLMPVIELPAQLYDKPAFCFDRMLLRGNTWGVETSETVRSGAAHCVDCFCVENLVNAWVYAVRRGELVNYLDHYIKSSGLPYMFDFKSRGLDAPTLRTPEEIYQKLSGMDEHLILKQPAYHSVTTPIIEISQDGCHAKAVWMDFCNTNMVLAFGKNADGSGVPYFAAMNKYVYTLQKVDGLWYLTHWYFEPQLSITRHTFDPKQSKGWCTSDDDQLYYAPLEE